MSRDSSKDGSDWQASWSDAETNLLKASLAATPAQRLEWLEEAIKLAYASGALPAPSREEEASKPPSTNR